MSTGRRTSGWSWAAGVVALLVSLVAGCGAFSVQGQEEGGDNTVVSGVASGVEATVGATPGTVADEDTEAASGADEFVDEGTASGGTGKRADAILGVRFGEHEDYERLVLDLGVAEQPAAEVPRWSVTRATGDGLLRIALPSARTTAVSDGELGGPENEILDQFYAVRAPDGGLFVDVFAGRSFEYRTIELGDPARLVVDFRAGEGELEVPLPEVAFNTVLVEPRSGASTDGALTVSGYSRNPEAMNTVILEGPEGKVLARKSVLGNDWTSTWGYFEATLDASGLSGEGNLRVGAGSARDGSFEGVEVPVAGG